MNVQATDFGDAGWYCVAFEEEPAGPQLRGLHHAASLVELQRWLAGQKLPPVQSVLQPDPAGIGPGYYLTPDGGTTYLYLVDQTRKHLVTVGADNFGPRVPARDG